MEFAVNAPEDRLLLLCARLELSPLEGQRLEALLQDRRLSWERLLRKAEWYRVSALVYYHLRGYAGPGAPPAWAIQRLKAGYVRNAARNVYLMSRLRRALDALRARGIPAIVLKGAALQGTVYPSPALRPMADLDLLVPEDRAEQAQAIIAGLGYSAVGTAEAQERTRRNHRHLPALVDQHGVVAFEVHSHIVSRDSPLRFHISSFWERARPAPVAGTTALALAPEHMLLHLAVHFFLDRRFRSYAAVSQLCDIAEAIRRCRPAPDWGYLKEQADALHLTGPLYCALSFARELLDAPIPADFLAGMAPEAPDRAMLEGLLRRRVLNTRRVLVSALVAPDADYSLPNLVVSALRRLVPSRSYLAEHYVAQDAPLRPGALYLKRVGDAGSLLARYLCSPVEMWQELRVDRWLHSLQRNGRRP